MTNTNIIDCTNNTAASSNNVNDEDDNSINYIMYTIDY